MLFFSSDNSEVELVEKEFTQAGIECEVRNGARKPKTKLRDAELWIRHDRDCHRALMLCVHLGIGFSKRPENSPKNED